MNLSSLSSFSPEGPANHVADVAHHEVHRHVHVQQAEQQHHRVRRGREELRPREPPAAAQGDEGDEPEGIPERVEHAAPGRAANPRHQHAAGGDEGGGRGTGAFILGVLAMCGFGGGGSGREGIILSGRRYAFNYQKEQACSGPLSCLIIHSSCKDEPINLRQ